jgi:hypothetical protein
VILNPFRVGIDGTAAVCREKYRRLRRYVKRHPEVGTFAGLILNTRKGSPKLLSKRPHRDDEQHG